MIMQNLLFHRDFIVEDSGKMEYDGVGGLPVKRRGVVLEVFGLSFVLQLLDTKMPRPMPYGIFHIAWVLAALLAVFLLRKKTGEQLTERVFAVFGWTSLVLEALKQFSWSFSYNAQGALVFDYQWYAAPFQLCTTPAFVAALYPFFKSVRVRDALRGYLAYFTVLGSIAVALMPGSIFTDEVLINVHTSFLHMGGLFISLWLPVSGRVKAKRDFWGGYKVFLFFAGMAFVLNIAVYHLFDLGVSGETFDMFYISPYYISAVPVFSTLDSLLPYPIFLFLYLLAFLIGGILMASIVAGVQRLRQKHR